jgi:predicted acyltransferase
VFRGITVAAMLLVNDPGSWSHIYPLLRHAAWHGWTPTDLIFPFFLFIMGVTTHLSLAARRARGADDRRLARDVLRRGLIIILLGLLLSAFPFFPPERISQMRIPGVLQRIGVVYLVTGFLVLRTSLRAQIAVAVAILVGYRLLLGLVPAPGVGYPALAPADSTLAAWVDRRVLDGHLWAVTRTWDPEGLLPTLPAIATCLLGVLAGSWITRPAPLSQRLRGLLALGAAGLLTGWLWSQAFPINKNLWTSSYVVFTAGMACAALAACMWIIEGRRAGWWTRPFVVFGVNPIVAFVGAEAIARLIYSVISVRYQGEMVPLQVALYRGLGFEAWPSPEAGSLAFAVMVVLFWYGVLELLYRRGVVIRI